MTEIQRIETSDQDPYESSEHYPWMDADTTATNHLSKEPMDRFLPCHYFDYIAGTSTGG